MNELTIEATLENMYTVLGFVKRHISECPEKVQNQIAIVVDEIFSNIARCAYSPGVGNVTVRVALKDSILLEFEDSGIAYDPLSKEDPDLTLDLEEREIGGLGIFITKNIMDEMEYRRDGDNNILTMKKYLHDD